MSLTTIEQRGERARELCVTVCVRVWVVNGITTTTNINGKGQKEREDRLGFELGIKVKNENAFNVRRVE